MIFDTVLLKVSEDIFTKFIGIVRNLGAVLRWNKTPWIGGVVLMEGEQHPWKNSRLDFWIALGAYHMKTHPFVTKRDRGKSIELHHLFYLGSVIRMSLRYLCQHTTYIIAQQCVRYFLNRQWVKTCSVEFLKCCLIELLKNNLLPLY